MQHFLSQVSDSWMQKVHPRIASLIAFFGIVWLGICALTLYLLAELSDQVLEQEAFAFDKTVLLGIHQLANPVLDQIMIGITRLGDPRTVVPLTFIILCILWLRRYFLEANFFALNALGGAILSYVLKLVFSKARPALWPQLISEATFSYPSGHAMGSIVLYGFLSYVLASLYPRYGKAFYGAAALLIVAIGFSRLYLGVHWPTDIIAGYGIGFLWVSVCVTLLRLRKLKGAGKSKQAR